MNIQELWEGRRSLDEFDEIHTVTYLQFETQWYGSIMLWSDKPLWDFTFVSLDVAGHYWRSRQWREPELVIETKEVLLTIPKLLPTDAVVLNVAFAHYLIPHGAIIFTDERGDRWRMFVTESMAGGDVPIFHLGQAYLYQELEPVEMRYMEEAVAFLAGFPTLPPYLFLQHSPHKNK